MVSHRESGIVVGAARSERAAAIDLVRQWLDAVNQAQPVSAASLMTTPVSIVVSGGQRFSRLEDFLAFSLRRHAGLYKQVEAFEACEAAGGLAVYARGRLAGRESEALAAQALRWCDRFLVEHGRIVDLQTWSDCLEPRMSPSLPGDAASSREETTP